MSDQAWGFATAVFLALFGAGGFFQWRRVSKKLPTAEKTEELAESAAEVKGKIDSLLPIVLDLQQRLNDAEESQIEVMILLSAHNEWDQRVFREIKKYDPEFPAPPPIHPKKKELGD